MVLVYCLLLAALASFNFQTKTCAWKVDLTNYYDRANVADGIQFQFTSDRNQVFTVAAGESVTLPCAVSILISNLTLKFTWSLLNTATLISVDEDVLVPQTSSRYTIIVDGDNIQQRYSLQIADVQSDVVGFYQCVVAFQNVTDMMVFQVSLSNSSSSIQTTTVTSALAAVYPHVACCISLGVGPRCLPGCMPSATMFMYSNAFNYQSLCGVSELNAIVTCVAPKVGGVTRCCQRRGIDQNCIHLCSTTQAGQVYSVPGTNLSLPSSTFSPPLFTIEDSVTCNGHFDTVMHCFIVPDSSLPPTPSIVSVSVNANSSVQVQIEFPAPFVPPFVIQSFEPPSLQSTVASDFTLAVISGQTNSTRYIVATGPNWSGLGAASGRDGAQVASGPAPLLGFNVYWTTAPQANVFSVQTLEPTGRNILLTPGPFRVLTVFVDAINYYGLSYPSHQYRLLNPVDTVYATPVSPSVSLFSRCLAAGVTSDCAALLCNTNYSYSYVSGGVDSSPAALFAAPPDYIASFNASATMTPPLGNVGNLLSIIDSMAASRCIGTLPAVLNVLTSGTNVTACCVASGVPPACLRICSGSWQLYTVLDIGCLYQLPAITRCYEFSLPAAGVPQPPQTLTLLSQFDVTPELNTLTLPSTFSAATVTILPYSAILPTDTVESGQHFEFNFANASANFVPNYADKVACTFTWMPPTTLPIYAGSSKPVNIVDYLLVASPVIQHSVDSSSSGPDVLNQPNMAEAATYTFPVRPTSGLSTNISLSITVLLPRGSLYDVYVVARSLYAQSIPSNVVRFITEPPQTAFSVSGDGSLTTRVSVTTSVTPETATPSIATAYKPTDCCAAANVTGQCALLCRALTSANNNPSLAIACSDQLATIFYCLSGGQSALRCCVSRNLPSQFNSLCSAGIATPLAASVQMQPPIGSTWSWQVAVSNALAMRSSLLTNYLLTLRVCFASNFGMVPVAPSFGIISPTNSNSFVVSWSPAVVNMPFVVANDPNSTNWTFSELPSGLSRTTLLAVGVKSATLKIAYYVRYHNYVPDLAAASSLPSYFSLPTDNLFMEITGLKPATQYVVQVSVEQYNVFTGTRVRGYSSSPMFVYTAPISNYSDTVNNTDWHSLWNETADCARQHLGWSFCDQQFIALFPMPISLFSTQGFSNFSKFQSLCANDRDATACCARRQLPTACLPLCNSTNVKELPSNIYAACAPFMCIVQTCAAGDPETPAATLAVPPTPWLNYTALNSSAILVSYAPQPAPGAANGAFVGQASPSDAQFAFTLLDSFYSNVNNSTMLSVNLYLYYALFNDDTLQTPAMWTCVLLPSNATSFALTGLSPASVYATFTIAVGLTGASLPTPITTLGTPPLEFDLPFVIQTPPGVITVGSNVTLRCSAPWNSAVSWLFNGKPMPHAGLGNSALAIANVSSTHAGTFSCLINSVHGHTLTPPGPQLWAASVAVRVLAPPVVTVPRTVVYARHLTTAVLTCVFRGYVTSVGWLRGTLSSANADWPSRYVTSITNYAADASVYAELRIFGVTYADLDSASFSCQGNNSLGSATGTISLLSPIMPLYANATPFNFSLYNGDKPTRSCCQKQNVNIACMSACNNSIIDLSFSFAGNCIRSFPALLRCAYASDPKPADHTPCCKSNNVPYNCLPACRGVSLSAADSHVLNCFNYTLPILRCLQERVAAPPPAAPTNLLLLSQTSAGANINWTSSNSRVSIYLLSLTCVSCASPPSIASPYHANLPLNTPPELYNQTVNVFRVPQQLSVSTSYKVPLRNITLGQNYSLTIYALVDNYASPASTPLVFTAGYKPVPPNGSPSVRSKLYTDYVLTWSPLPADSVAPLLYYTIYATPVTSRKRRQASMNDTSVSSYRVSADASSYTLTCLQVSTTYSVWLTATNAVGESAPGVTSQFVTSSQLNPICIKSTTSTASTSDSIAVGLTIVVCVICVLIVVVVLVSIGWVLRHQIAERFTSLTQRMAHVTVLHQFSHHRFSDTQSVNGVHLDECPTATPSAAMPYSSQDATETPFKQEPRSSAIGFENVAYDSYACEVTIGDPSHRKGDPLGNTEHVDRYDQAAGNTLVLEPVPTVQSAPPNRLTEFAYSSFT